MSQIVADLADMKQSSNVVATRLAALESERTALPELINRAVTETVKKVFAIRSEFHTPHQVNTAGRPPVFDKIPLEESTLHTPTPVGRGMQSSITDTLGIEERSHGRGGLLPAMPDKPLRTLILSIH